MRQVLVMVLVSLAVFLASVGGTAGAAETAPLATKHEEPAGEGATETKVTLRWKAQNEDRAYGYLIYRAEARQGPFRRVSHRIVRVVEGDAAEASAYTWTDHDVVAGTTYYYYLDIVSIGGIKQRFSGVLSRKAEPVATESATPPATDTGTP